MSKMLLVSLLAAATATVSPTPDLSKVTEADIQATIAHRNALHEQLIQQTLPAASDDVKESLAKAQVLQKGIDDLALQAARVAPLEEELKKAHAAIWRDILLFSALGFAVGLFGPKLLGLASMVGV